MTLGEKLGVIFDFALAAFAAYIGHRYATNHPLRPLFLQILVCTFHFYGLQVALDETAFDEEEEIRALGEDLESILFFSTLEEPLMLILTLGLIAGNLLGMKLSFSDVSSLVGVIIASIVIPFLSCVIGVVSARLVWMIKQRLLR